MKIDEYFQLLVEGKEREAEEARISTIPDKLIKFIWLDESEKDDLKFLTLKRDEMWIAHKDSLNDPYEYKGMLIDKEKFDVSSLLKLDIRLKLSKSIKQYLILMIMV